MSTISSVDELVQALAKDTIPPLRGVPKPILDQFRGGLRFAKGGLAHADYSMLQDHVPHDKLKELFSHFGVSPAKFEDMEDTSCVDGVCFFHPNAFCDPDYCHH